MSEQNRVPDEKVKEGDGPVSVVTLRGGEGVVFVLQSGERVSFKLRESPRTEVEIKAPFDTAWARFQG